MKSEFPTLALTTGYSRTSSVNDINAHCQNHKVEEECDFNPIP
jgi:hypothetical protein